MGIICGHDFVGSSCRTICHEPAFSHEVVSSICFFPGIPHLIGLPSGKNYTNRIFPRTPISLSPVCSQVFLCSVCFVTSTPISSSSSQYFVSCMDFFPMPSSSHISEHTVDVYPDAI
jgi:hypothetical protein